MQFINLNENPHNYKPESTALSWNKMVKITTDQKQLPVKIKDINSRKKENEHERLTLELF